MYLLLFCSFRLFGARMLSGNTLFDTVIFLMVGAVAGRAVLGHPPTLGAGIIGVVTFLAIELTFGKMRKYRAARKSPHTTARLIFAHGAPLPLQMKQARVSSHDIITAARTSGATSLAEIQCMILEENGKISVFSEERPISSELLADVKDRELL